MVHGCDASILEVEAKGMQSLRQSLSRLRKLSQQFPSQGKKKKRDEERENRSLRVNMECGVEASLHS